MRFLMEWQSTAYIMIPLTKSQPSSEQIIVFNLIDEANLQWRTALLRSNYVSCVKYRCAKIIHM